MPTPRPPIIVGIAGGSASGKSTLTRALAEMLQQYHVIVINADRYMRKNIDDPDTPTFYSPSSGTTMFDANHPNSINWTAMLYDLDALLKGTERPEVLLIEGHLLFCEQRVRERLHIRIFIELDADERALRRMLRDMQGGRTSRDPVFIANYYRECARVGHARYIEPSRVHADLIVRGDADWKRLGPMLSTLIESRI